MTSGNVPDGLGHSNEIAGLGSKRTRIVHGKYLYIILDISVLILQSLNLLVILKGCK